MGAILNFTDSQKIYKLEGKSLQAALAVKQLTDSYLSQKSIEFNGRNMKDIGDDFDSAYEHVARTIKAKKPELLETLGLDKPATRVVDTYGLFQRAYHIYPSIWMSEIDGSIYMYAPVDYKGQHFAPQDGVLLNKEDANKAGDKVFMGGWGSPTPILPRKESAAILPADFDSVTSTMLENDPLLQNHGERHHRFFMLRENGRSAQILAEYKDSQGHESRSFHALTNHISAEFNKIVASNTIENADPAKNYCPGFMMGRDQKTREPQIEIMIQSDRPDFNSVKASFAEQGDYFDTRYRHNRPVMVPHERTPEAAHIKALFDKISRKPSLYDYEDIIYPEYIAPSDEIDAMMGDKRAPIIRELGKDSVLEYRINKGKPVNFCPPDSVEISKKLYLWLKENEEDSRRGYNIPAMPSDLKKEYKLAKTLTMARSVKPRPPAK